MTQVPSAYFLSFESNHPSFPIFGPWLRPLAPAAAHQHLNMVRPRLVSAGSCSHLGSNLLVGPWIEAWGGPRPRWPYQSSSKCLIWLDFASFHSPSSSLNFWVFSWLLNFTSCFRTRAPRPNACRHCCLDKISTNDSSYPWHSSCRWKSELSDDFLWSTHWAGACRSTCRGTRAASTQMLYCTNVLTLRTYLIITITISERY